MSLFLKLDETYLTCKMCYRSQHHTEFSAGYIKKLTNGQWGCCRTCNTGRVGYYKRINALKYPKKPRSLKLKLPKLKPMKITSTAYLLSASDWKMLRLGRLSSIFRLWCKTGIWPEY